MANFEARTSSNGITLTPDQHRKLREYVDQFNFCMEDGGFTTNSPILMAITSGAFGATIGSRSIRRR
jgi:hypothetical protein